MAGCEYKKLVTPAMAIVKVRLRCEEGDKDRRKSMITGALNLCQMWPTRRIFGPNSASLRALCYPTWYMNITIKKLSFCLDC